MKTVILLIWAHLFADFFLQTDKMATTKSSSNRWLTIHVLTYSAVLLVFGPVYALVNGALHWITDYISSRKTSALWQKGERHWFFVVIGIDQAVHMTCLVLTIPLMGW